MGGRIGTVGGCIGIEILPLLFSSGFASSSFASSVFLGGTHEVEINPGFELDARIFNAAQN